MITVQTVDHFEKDAPIIEGILNDKPLILARITSIGAMNGGYRMTM